MATLFFENLIGTLFYTVIIVQRFLKVTRVLGI